jgi:uncharacterized membrane protein YbaN (DUF454 family)
MRIDWKRVRQSAFNILATVFFAAGIIGIVFPFIPTAPFLALSFLCLCKGSNELKSSNLYKNHISPFLFFKTMTSSCKIIVIASFLGVVSMLFVFSKSYIFKLVISIITLLYIYYFCFIIKTTPKNKIRILPQAQKKLNKER